MTLDGCKSGHLHSIQLMRNGSAMPVPLRVLTFVGKVGLELQIWVQSSGDYNCLFRSFSYIITGSDEQHMAVRAAIVSYMVHFHHIKPYTSVQEYVKLLKWTENQHVVPRSK